MLLKILQYSQEYSQSLFVIKLPACKLPSSLKRDSNTSVFLLILLFLRTIFFIEKPAVAAF